MANFKAEKKRIKNKTCSDCKKKKATIEFCNSVLEWTHGFSEFLCVDCYKKRIKQTIKDCEKTLKELDKSS